MCFIVLYSLADRSTKLVKIDSFVYTNFGFFTKSRYHYGSKWAIYILHVLLCLTNERAEYCSRIGQLAVISLAGKALEIGGENNVFDHASWKVCLTRLFSQRSRVRFPLWVRQTFQLARYGCTVSRVRVTPQTSHSPTDTQGPRNQGAMGACAPLHHFL